MFTIDFTKPWLYKDIIYFNQGNLSTNNTLRCKLVTGGSDDFTGGSIACRFETKDSPEINGLGRLVDAKSGIVDIVFPSNSLVVGTNKLEVLVNRADGGVAQSPPVMYDIWQGLTTGNGIEAETNYPILIQLINSTNEASNKANSALNKANSMITDVTDAIDNAYRSANDADIATSNANTKIEEVETAKTEMIKKVDTSIVTMKSEVEIAKNEMASKADEKIADVDIALASGTKDLEVKEARRDMDGVEHPTLKVRLESDLKKGKVVEETKEGTYLSFNDTVGGLVSYLEVLGNTVQDVTNLSNIRSSCIPNGDGTFKMSILSVGENLWSIGSMEHGKTYYTKLPIGQFTFSLVASSTTSARVGIFVVNEDNSALSSKVITNNVLTNITFTNTKVQNVGFKIGGWDSGAMLQSTKDIKLQEGTVATPYTPYQETRCDIKLPCQLEKVGNVADRLYFDKNENAWCVGKRNIKYNLLDYITNASDIKSYADGGGDHLAFYVYIGNVQCEVDNMPRVMCKGFNQAMIGSDVSSTSTKKSCYASYESLNNRTYISFSLPRTLVPNSSTSDVWKYLKDEKPIFTLAMHEMQKIVLPQSEQIKLNSFANKTHIYTISGDVDATVKATVSKSLASTVQANTNEINILNGKIEDIQGLKESQDFAYETDKGYLVCKDTQSGVVKDLKVYGKSLVNKSKIKTTSFEGRIIGLYSNNNYPLNGFTIVTNVTKNTTSKGIALSLTDVNGVITYPLLINANTVGRAVWYFDKVVKDISIYQQLDDYGADKAIVDDIVIIEGDHRNNLPNGYFEGIASVGNGNKIEVLSSNMPYDYSVELVSNIRKNFKLKKDIVAGDVIKNISDKSVIALVFDSTTLSWVRDATLNKGDTYIVPNGNVVKTITIYPHNGWNISSEIFLESLISVNNYLKQDKKTSLFKDIDNTWKPILNLRGIDENNCDTIDSVNNKFIKKINERTITGNDLLSIDVNINIEGYKAYKIELPKYKEMLGLNTIICDKYPCNVGRTEQKEGIYNTDSYSGKRTITLRLPTSKASTIEEAKQYVNNNNFKVAYVMNVFEEYEINPIYPESHDNNTMISFGSGAIAPHASWKITSSLPNFVKELSNQIKQLQEQVYKTNVANFAVALNTLDTKLRLDRLEAPQM